MAKKTVGKAELQQFSNYLREEERSELTHDKYMHDVRKFSTFCNGRPVTKDLVISYKQSLIHDGYCVRTINSMISALNTFLKFMKMNDCQVKILKAQQRMFMPEERELTKDDYQKLCDAALRNKKEKLYLLLQTLSGTGIRISELQFITAEAVAKGKATVSCKGKVRIVFLVSALQRKLQEYCKCRGIKEGPVFITKYGKPLNRRNIWRAMKNLCESCGISKNKVFPHNFRHLFAKEYYSVNNDIVKLADVMGHSNISTTRIYVATSGMEHLQQLENMDLVK